ncbi:MAG: DUF4368 domain-containing protein, partial [Clostridia bacterium]|nr:DUF4368 domain-containing protein [Clostridia bacterium]
VITKDLSRLGRNYILTGQYTEIYFPSKGVRYIAINDNVDTEKGDSELAPFLNILNEMHARQTSKKVKSALRIRNENGAHYSTYAPIGYMKDPNDKGHLLVDDETKWVIEKIFELAYHGAGAARITTVLMEEKIPTPAWFNYTRYGTFSRYFIDADENRPYAWTISQVKNILKDEVYLGHSVHNRQSTISFKNKKKVRKPKDEWYKVENTHEAIISKDVFDSVQKQIESRRRVQKNGTTQIFAGLLKCPDCNWGFSYGTGKTKKGSWAHYSCTNYKQGHRACTMHYIRYDVLYEYVLSRLRYWAKEVKKDDSELLKRLMDIGNEEYRLANKKRLSELRKAEKRKSEVDNLFQKIYEDRYEGKLSENNFDMLAGKYQAEQTELDNKIRAIKAELESLTERQDNTEKWVSLIRQYSDIEELNAELLNTLIEKIVIHEAVKNNDGTRVQEIEIYYKFIGKID